VYAVLKLRGTAAFDALGRRIRTVVSNSGDPEAATRYYYDGQKIIETRLGTETAMHRQFIHGMLYIDEIVMVRVANKGDLYIHQDANWNVIGMTDLGGSLVERYKYNPYGQFTIDQHTGYGDRDGDGDVNATDKGTPGTTCTIITGACRMTTLHGHASVAHATLGHANPTDHGVEMPPDRKRLVFCIIRGDRNATA